MRYTPFESMERMLDAMRRDVSDWHVRTDWPGDGLDRPGRGLNADLTERDGEYVLTVDMPGFETDEIDLVLDDGHLTVSAVHQVDDETTSRARSISERFVVPKPVVEADAAATYSNGVLEVRLPIEAGADDRGHRIDVD